MNRRDASDHAVNAIPNLFLFLPFFFFFVSFLRTREKKQSIQKQKNSKHNRKKTKKDTDESLGPELRTTDKHPLGRPCVDAQHQVVLEAPQEHDTIVL